MKAHFLTLLCMILASSATAETYSYMRWNVDIGPQTSEAHTANAVGSSMGLFCGGNQCSFYLNTNLNCQPGKKYPVLLNSTSLSTAITMKCTLVGSHPFQILEPFETVFNAIQTGDAIGFAVAVNSGEFIANSFSLAGASDAVAKTISATAERANKPPVQNTNPSQGLIKL